jgi:hypothetical protein
MAKFLEIDGEFINIEHVVSIKPIYEFGSKTVNGHKFKLTNGETIMSDWSRAGVEDTLEGMLINEE